tara:strand:+ start:1202 stop:1390 length:189 start_codon:yes stop_codon:yes gene_type:complete
VGWPVNNGLYGPINYDNKDFAINSYHSSLQDYWLYKVTPGLPEDTDYPSYIIYAYTAIFNKL